MRLILKLFILLFLLIAPWLVFAADSDCPFGLTDDEYPGYCARYVDEDNNDLCDLSEIPLAAGSADSATGYVSEDELKNMTVRDMAGVYNISPVPLAQALGKYLGQGVLPEDSLRELHDRHGLCMGVAGKLAAGLQKSGAGSGAEQADPVNSVPAKAGISARYKLIPIAISTIILYLFTLYLARKKALKLLVMRRIWNLVLLISFLASALSGLFLIIRLNWGWSPALPFDMLYWHVETGTVMMVVTAFHVSWYWRALWPRPKGK